MDISARVKELSKISFDIDLFDDASLNPADNLESVLQEVDTAKVNQDLQLLIQLRAKERALLNREIVNLRAQLVKKNDLINVTLESQEKLAENQVQYQKQLNDSKAQLDQSRLDAQDLEIKLEEAKAAQKQLVSEIELKESRNRELTAQVAQLEQLKKAEEQKGEQMLAGISELVKMSLQEQFLAQKITEEHKLDQLMNQHGQKQLLEDNFLLPTSIQSLVDATPSGLFRLLDRSRLAEVSQTELEIAFRQLKDTLD